MKKDKKMNKNSKENAMTRMSMPIGAAIFAWFGLCGALNAFGVVPAPDGGYPNFNTAEGDNAFLSLTTGIANTAVGSFSLESLTTGSFNTATGAGSLLFNTADNNTAFGGAALLFNTDAPDNTAVGASALLNNTAADNTAIGSNALLSNTTGVDNTASGAFALFSNTEGGENTAIGFDALFSNTTGGENTAIGFDALLQNTTGVDNTASGVEALQFNTTGFQNTANGVATLQSNTIGSFNSADGTFALRDNTTGQQNTANGSAALLNNTTGDNNTAIGVAALGNNTEGSGNIALGVSAGSSVTTGSNNIHIGHPGDASGDSDTIRIGQTQTRTFIGGIFGQTTSGAAIPVVIDEAAQLGTQSSSRRFKTDIQPMDRGSESILALKPVRFHYKSDKTATPQFGLIAEEVAEVNPNLVVRDKKGEIYTVRYDAVSAMLLNEFLKEHRKVEQQQTTIAELKKELGIVLASLKEQNSKIQRVSAQLEMTRSGRRIVNNQR
jgi:hypothetical protein